MFYTELGLTQYEMHDPVSFLDRYNKDMQIITTSATVAAGKIEMVEQESKDRDESLQDAVDKNHSEIIDNANHIIELQAQDKALKAAIDLNKQDIVALQVTTTSISAQLLNHIETSTSYASGIVKEIKDNYTELKTNILADRERLAVAETAIANIEQDNTEITGIVTALEADNEQNKNSIASLERVDSEHAESINDLRDRVTTAESEILQNTNDITSLDKRTKAAEQNIEDLQLTNIDAGLGNVSVKLTNNIVMYPRYNWCIQARGYYYGEIQYLDIGTNINKYTPSNLNSFRLDKAPFYGPITIIMKVSYLTYNEHGENTINELSGNIIGMVSGDDLEEINRKLGVIFDTTATNWDNAMANDYLKYISIKFSIYGEN